RRWFPAQRRKVSDSTTRVWMRSSRAILRARFSTWSLSTGRREASVLILETGRRVTRSEITRALLESGHSCFVPPKKKGHVLVPGRSSSLRLGRRGHVDVRTIGVVLVRRVPDGSEEGLARKSNDNFLQ